MTSWQGVLDDRAGRLPFGQPTARRSGGDECPSTADRIHYVNGGATQSCHEQPTARCRDAVVRSHSNLTTSGVVVVGGASSGSPAVALRWPVKLTAEHLCASPRHRQRSYLLETVSARRLELRFRRRAAL